MLCVLIPSLGFADKSCTFKASQLKEVVYYRQSGNVHVMVDRSHAHFICSIRKDGDRCHDLHTIALGAIQGGRGLTLRYADNNYNCQKHWGGKTAPSHNVRYLYLNK